MSLSSDQATIIMGAQLVFVIVAGALSAYGAGSATGKVLGVLALLALISLGALGWLITENCGSLPATERCVIW